MIILCGKIILCRFNLHSYTFTARGSVLFLLVPFHILAVRPQLFKTVEHTRFVVKNVNNDSAVIEHRPFPFRHAVRMRRSYVVLLQFLLDKLGERFNLLIALCLFLFSVHITK